MQEEIQNLKEQAEKLERTLSSHNEAIREMIRQIQLLGNIVSENANRDAEEHVILQGCINNRFFERNDPRECETEYFYPEIVDAKTAVSKIIAEKKSIARFGDGEFAIICGYTRYPFQDGGNHLGERLKEVLRSELDNLFIGIADNYGSLEKYTESAANAIRIYMQPDIRKAHMQLLSKEKTYYDAYLFRPYVMYKDKYTDAPKRRFEQIKQIWEGRDVIMIEGAQTRLGVGNDLFDGCRSVRRILAPAKNSYDRYDEVLECALKHGKKEDLFLIAAGPSAGVFAYDLTKNGFWAIDVGHIDIEYEWFLKGTGERELIPYKYSFEMQQDKDAEDISDPVYEAQIIDRFL